MTTEKLAKSLQSNAASPTPPKLTHKGFVNLLRFVKSNPRYLSFLGFRDNRAAGTSFIQSLLPVASAIEQLAPNLAGNGPNPEYPWESGGIVIPPCQHSFEGFDPKNDKLIKLVSLIDRLLDYAQ